MKVLETSIVPVCLPFQFSHAACAPHGAQPMLQLAFFLFEKKNHKNTHPLDAVLALLKKKAFIKKNTA